MKLFLSFLIPSVMWFTVGIWTSSQMRHLGSSVEGILADNERSITYAVEMVQALERMDSAILFKINGDDAAYNSIMDSAATVFRRSLDLAEANITVSGEKELLVSLRTASDDYFVRLDETAANPSMNLYNRALYPVFVETRRLVSDLRIMNSEAMYAASGKIIDRAKRAALPGDLIMVAALFFAIFFLILVQSYVVRPIRELGKAIESWCRTGKYEATSVETHDEIQNISEGLGRLRDRLAPGRQ